MYEHPLYDRVKENFPLNKLNTFGIRSTAKLFFCMQSEEEFQEIRYSDYYRKNGHVFLGEGSNVLLPEYIDAFVIKNNILGIELIDENENYAYLRVGAGENWHDFVIYSLLQGFYGLENLALIPGTVGAAPMQNIGAYGVEVKDFIDSVEVINLQTFLKEQIRANKLELGYRESIFKNKVKDKYLITRVNFRLNKKANLKLEYGAIKEVLAANKIENPSPMDIAKAVMEIRSSKLPDPHKIGNSGSFFKNPVIHFGRYQDLKKTFPDMPSFPTELEDKVKIPAGYLIEKTGWKGKKFGEVGVHDKQALVLVNHGSGKSTEIKELAEQIKLSVKETFQIDLETEVNYIKNEYPPSIQ